MNHEQAIERAEAYLGGGPIGGGDVEAAIKHYLTARAERKSFAKMPADQDISDEEYRQAMDAGRGYAELLLRDFDV